MSLPAWQALLLALVGGLAAARQGRGWIYLFQLDEYLPSRVVGTWRRRMISHWRWQLPLAASALALAAAELLAPPPLRAIPLVVASLLPLLFFRPFVTRATLHWTRRARRLAAISAGLCLLALFLAFWEGPVGAVLMGLVDALLVAALSTAAGLSQPYESLQRRRFMAAAEGSLRATSPVVVGITGSYGKTTTKVLLAQLLDRPEAPCFATPESYNTTLGVCRAINEGLRPEHRVVVVEMGAYRPGEIAEICSFTHPRVGIVTAVGLMHLERFGSRQRIAAAKGELLRALPEDGVAVVPSGIAERETLCAGLRARLISVGAPGDRWWAEGETTSAEGTAFRLRGSQGEELPLAVPLFGRHLVQDLLCALAVAVELGSALEGLALRAARLQGAPHRLQVSQNAGITIIDDAYNSNPEGAAEALRLLGKLPGSRRVLVTPGFIELGAEQEQSMRELGRRAAEVCSHVILVGPRHSAPVLQGLLGAGFPRSGVTVVADLDGAQAVLPQVAGPGSVVLFENDLPDQYLERR